MPNSMADDERHRNIRRLLRSSGPIRGSNIPRMYEEEFDEKLKYTGKLKLLMLNAGATVQGTGGRVAYSYHAEANADVPEAEAEAPDDMEAEDMEAEDMDAEVDATTETQGDAIAEGNAQGEAESESESESESEAEPHQGPGADNYLAQFETAVAPRLRTSAAQHSALRTDVEKDDEVCLLGFRKSQGLQPIYLDIHNPFSVLAIGLPGGGKSHTINCVLESCLLPHFNTRNPMAALVCHYEQSCGSSPCESIGLIHRSLSRCRLRARNAVVLCSPSNHRSIAKLYHDFDRKIDVVPLRFRWRDLGASQLMKLMRLEESAGQLYLSVMLDMLRGYHQSGSLPSLKGFIEEVTAHPDFNESQRKSVTQRLRVLERFVVDPDDPDSDDIDQDFDPYRGKHLIVADLTDPYLNSSEVNGVFQVAISQFRNSEHAAKVLVLDEAHRYMSGSDGLAETVTTCARMRRHDGLRLIVSTQSPLVLPPELVDLANVFVAHRYQSPEWHSFISDHLPFNDSHFTQARNLGQGEALVYCSSAANDGFLGLQIRPRLTSDLGQTRANVGGGAAR